VCVLSNQSARNPHPSAKKYLITLALKSSLHLHILSIYLFVSLQSVGLICIYAQFSLSRAQQLLLKFWPSASPEKLLFQTYHTLFLSSGGKLL
jgi:hypothetical protein